MRTKLIPALGGLLAIVVLAGVLGIIVTRSGPAQRTIVATFAEAPGLYAGNHVDVLDIPVGTIQRVKATGTGVVVTMKVPASLKLPAGVGALLDAPQVVTDRYVQLQPAYHSGPVVTDKTLRIPMSRTAEPLSTEQILNSLDTLLAALGPTAADGNGVLGGLIKTLDRQLGGQGTNFHNAIGSASQAAGTLAADSPGLAATLTSLGSFIKTAASDAGEYTQFASDLSGAAAELDQDRGSLATALSTLATVLGQVTTFIQANGGNLKSTLDNVSTALAAVNKNQSALAQFLRIVPLTLQNVDRAIESSSTGPAIAARFDALPDTLPLVRSICGQTAKASERLGVIVQDGFAQHSSNVPTQDLICVFAETAGAFPIPPGSAQGPDLALSSLYQAGK